MVGGMERGRERKRERDKKKEGEKRRRRGGAPSARTYVAPGSGVRAVRAVLVGPLTVFWDVGTDMSLPAAGLRHSDLAVRSTRSPSACMHATSSTAAVPCPCPSLRLFFTMRMTHGFSDCK